MKLIDGKFIAATIQLEMAEEVKEFVAKGNRPPHLAAILVGNDGGSLTYVEAKVKACERIGFNSTLIQLDENTSEEQLLAAVAQLNNDSSIDGFIVQLPLPKHINEQKVIEAVDPKRMWMDFILRTLDVWC